MILASFADIDSSSCARVLLTFIWPTTPFLHSQLKSHVLCEPSLLATAKAGPPYLSLWWDFLSARQILASKYPWLYCLLFVAWVHLASLINTAHPLPKGLSHSSHWSPPSVVHPTDGCLVEMGSPDP